MALEHEIDALAAQAGAKRRQRILALIKWRWRRRVVLAYRKLFVGEDGQLTPEAVIVMADIGNTARLGVVDLAAASDAELRERAGRRSLALHIIGRMDLDGSALRDLSKKLRELGNE